MIWAGHSFDKDVASSAVDRGYTFEYDARVTVLPEINAVGERIQHAVVGDGLAVGAAHLLFPKIVVDLLGGIAVRTHCKHLLHDGSRRFIDLQLMSHDLNQAKARRPRPERRLLRALRLILIAIPLGVLLLRLSPQSIAKCALSGCVAIASG